MERKILKHGNRIINNDTDGYIYSYNRFESHDFGSHIHDCFEFIHIIEGKILYTVENSEYMLTNGDLIITKPSEFHSFSFPQKGTYAREFLHIYPGFFKDYPEIIENLSARKDGYFNRIPAETVEKYGIDKIFDGIYSYCENPIEETDFMTLTYALQLATKTHQIIKSEFPQKQDITKNSKVSDAYKFMDKNFRENLTINDIAAAMYMSPAYASRLFKKEMGMTIKAYLNMRRITNAKSLIIRGHKTTSIFSECGFRDYSTFYRTFVKYVGMTPENFAKMQKRP